MSTVEYAIDDDGISTLTLNRDDKRNAVNRQMAGEILRRLEQAEDQEARVVILRANPGVKVWCAGHDLSEVDPRKLPDENPTLEILARIQHTKFQLNLLARQTSLTDADRDGVRENNSQIMASPDTRERIDQILNSLRMPQRRKL